MKSFFELREAKATPCGRCGTTHVPPSQGGTCPALSKEESVNTADKKPETYKDPAGKMKTRMVPTDKEVVKEKTLTPAEKKKREEIAQAMERDNPGMDTSKKMAIATATAKRVAENVKQKGKIIGFRDQFKSRDVAASEGQRAMKKLGGISFSVYKATNGLWAYKVFGGSSTKTESHDQLDELSKKTLGNYIRAAGPDREAKLKKAQQHTNTGHQLKQYADDKKSLRHAQQHFQISGELQGKAANRKIGINKAVDRLTKEEAKPDAVEVMRKKQQMANISTSDKDKLAKIRAMLNKEKKPEND